MCQPFRKQLWYILYHNIQAVKPLKSNLPASVTAQRQKTEQALSIQQQFVLHKMTHVPRCFPASSSDLSAIAHASTSNYVCISGGRRAEQWCIYCSLHTAQSSYPGLKRWPSCQSDRFRRKSTFFCSNILLSTHCQRKCKPTTKNQIHHADSQVKRQTNSEHRDALHFIIRTTEKIRFLIASTSLLAGFGINSWQDFPEITGIITWWFPFNTTSTTPVSFLSPKTCTGLATAPPERDRAEEGGNSWNVTNRSHLKQADRMVLPLEQAENFFACYQDQVAWLHTHNEGQSGASIHPSSSALSLSGSRRVLEPLPAV